MGSTSATAVGPATGTTMVLHGRHPLRGYPVTWRIRPAATDGRRNAPPSFVVERADGHIEDDLVWQLAEKESAVVGAAEVHALVERVRLNRRAVVQVPTQRTG